MMTNGFHPPAEPLVTKEAGSKPNTHGHAGNQESPKQGLNSAQEPPKEKKVTK